MKRALQIIFRFLFQLFYRVEITGFEHFPESGGYIIAPNHTRILDAPLLIAFLPMEFGAMGKSSLDKNWILGPIFRAYHGIPVTRSGEDMRAIRQAIDLLQTLPVVLFAEGTTTEGGERLPAKPGLALIAKQAKVAIVPLTITGTYRLFHKIQIIAHPPLRVEDFGYTRYHSATYQAIGEQVLDIVYAPRVGGSD